MITNPFETIPDDADSVIAMVARAAREECHEGGCLIAPVLDRCAADAVTTYWDARIKTFVPLLALRHVRECIRVGSCDFPSIAH